MSLKKIMVSVELLKSKPHLQEMGLCKVEAPLSDSYNTQELLLFIEQWA